MGFRNRPPERPFIVLLVRRTALFFGILCLFALFLYVLGTGQEFTDGTQLLLLRFTTGTGILLSAVSVYGILLNFRPALHRHFLRRLGGIGGYLLSGLLGAAAAVFAAFISAAAEGNIR